MIAKSKAGSPETNHRALNVTGVRVTNQRASILGVIRQGGGHLDADEVYRRARQKQPNLSLSTVYRALQLFKRLGLVEEHHFDEFHHHYEIKTSKEHQHLLCLGCGKVVEFQCPQSREVREEIARDKGFEIVGAEVRIVGFCPECRQHREK